MKTRVIIVDANFLIREGIKSILCAQKNFDIVGEAENFQQLQSGLIKFKPDMIIIDPSAFTEIELNNLIADRKFTIMCLTEHNQREKIARVVKAGVDSYIFKDCDRQEMEEAIQATSVGQQYYCGKVLQAIAIGDADIDKNYSCKAVNISSREGEIIKLIAEGNTNKEIAEKLFLSNHTITTHRKNIMNKLGINNTAGLVWFAIKENLVSSPE